MSAPSYPATFAPHPKDTSFAYTQRRRAEQIYGLAGSGDYPELTSGDTAVLLALNYYSKPDGSDMRASTGTIALMTNISRRSVIRSLNRLLADGLLTVEAKLHSRAVVCYRFGDGVLNGTGKLRPMLEAKHAHRQMTKALAPQRHHCSATLSHASESHRASESQALCQGDVRLAPQRPEASDTETAASVILSHRTNIELIEQPTLEPIQDLTGNAEGASRPRDGDRLASLASTNVEDNPNTRSNETPPTDDEVRAFFESALSPRDL
jgi:hypothetical protein